MLLSEEPVQLPFPYQGRRINIDKTYDNKHNARIRYIGDAVEQFDGTWRALADIEGMLCLVEVKIRVAGE